jgi:drug/metabolite transporter (DMT)-like permease
MDDRPAGDPIRTGSASDAGAGLAAVVVAATGFSWGFILVKLIGMSPPALAFWRLLIGAVALIVAAGILRTPLPAVSGSLLTAGLAFGAHQLLFITSTSWTSVAIVTLIGAVQPLAVAVVSHRIVGERVSPALFGCALVAVAGVAIVVQSNLGHASQSLGGDLLALCNLVVFTVYFLAAKRARMDGAPTLTFTASVLSIAWLVICPGLLWGGLQAPSPRQWWLLALLALGSGNGHLFVNWAHPRLSVALSSMVLAAVPVLSTTWAYLVLDEPLTASHVLGMILVLGAIEGGRRAEARRLRRSR